MPSVINQEQRTAEITGAGSGFGRNVALGLAVKGTASSGREASSRTARDGMSSVTTRRTLTSLPRSLARLVFVAYVQFLEDSYETAGSFKIGGPGPPRLNFSRFQIISAAYCFTAFSPDTFPFGLINAVETNWLLLGELAILFAPGRTNFEKCSI